MSISGLEGPAAISNADQALRPAALGNALRAGLGVKRPRAEETDDTGLAIERSLADEQAVQESRRVMRETQTELRMHGLECVDVKGDGSCQ